VNADALIRRVDEDRWLSSRFAPKRARERLTALYALNYEIARTAETVTQEALGDMRLAWWAEAVAELYAGKGPRAHPALQAYAGARGEAEFSRARLDALISARGADLDAAPFASWAALESYVDASSGGLIALAMGACAPIEAARDEAQALAREAGRAWGYAGLLRAAPIWRARGRSFAPRETALSPERLAEALDTRARDAFEKARELAPRSPSALFPAFGHVAFAPRYLRAPNAPVPLLERQLRLIAAAATGRL
jgi:15-cis-phytoene synthase